MAPSSVAGADHPWPFQLTTWLLAVATAMHRLGVAHETETAPGPRAWPVAGTGADQVAPSKW
jgi:hypothetical protein